MKKFFQGARPGLAIAVIVIGLLFIIVIQAYNAQDINKHLDCLTDYFSSQKFYKKKLTYRHGICSVVDRKNK